MKRIFAAALIVPLALGFGTMAIANDAHHPGKQVKSKTGSAKKSTKKPAAKAPPKKQATE